MKDTQQFTPPKYAGQDKPGFMADSVLPNNQRFRRLYVMDTIQKQLLQSMKALLKEAVDSNHNFFCSHRCTTEF
jgi:hypothetical protein